MNRRILLLAGAASALALVVVVALSAVPGRPIAQRVQKLNAYFAERSSPPADAEMLVRCDLPSHPISPWIFGVGRDEPSDLGATARRLGGNTMSRYNFELGDAWNTAADWYFQNVKLPFTYETVIDAALTRGQALALTVPILGWVAKDYEAYSFPVAAYGPQEDVDSYKAQAGNGRTPDGKLIEPGPPTRTSVRMPPERVEAWIERIVTADAKRGRRGVAIYILDNEPDLWHDTHRDVHPEPVTYDELIERTIAYATAIRRADPRALIAGPASWGWPGYFYSAADAKAGFWRRPDRRAHGDVPLLAYYLRTLREHETRHKVRLLDILDVHYYPQNAGLVTGEGGGATEPAFAKLRLRATRSLWDPDYVDESWISDTVRLLPRMQELIAAEYPGRKLSIGEWNFGAEGHVSGGLAVAEVLGRLAEHRVYSAFYWTSPKPGSPAYFAFRAYRNYDGKGSHFLERYVASTTASKTSLFVSSDEKRTRLVAVALNLHPSVARHAVLDVKSCGTALALRRFEYLGTSDGFRERPSPLATTGPIRFELPPYGLTVLEVKLR